MRRTYILYLLICFLDKAKVEIKPRTVSYIQSSNCEYKLLIEY